MVTLVPGWRRADRPSRRCRRVARGADLEVLAEQRAAARRGLHVHSVAPADADVHLGIERRATARAEPLSEHVRIGPRAEDRLPWRGDGPPEPGGSCPRRGRAGVIPASRSSAWAAKNRSSASSWCSQKRPKTAIHSRASSMGSATSEMRCTRPSFRRATKPADSSTRTCLETAGSDMGSGSANLVTGDSPSASRTRMSRRVGSARAENSSSSSPSNA